MIWNTAQEYLVTSGCYEVDQVNGDGRDTEPPTVYVDGFTGALYLDKPHEIERYDTAFQDIWSAASSEAESRDFIKNAVRGMEA